MYNKNNIENKSEVFTTRLIIIVLFYSLFGLNRIKQFLGPTLNGRKGTNEIYLYGAIILIIIFINRMKIKKSNVLFIIFFTITSLFSFLINIHFFNEFIYSFLFIMIPLFYLISMKSMSIKGLRKILNVFIFTNLIYSFLTIFLSFADNTNFLYGILGNDLIVNNESTIRANLMLGSSITTSYYFLISIPLSIFIINSEYFNQKSKKIANLSIYLSSIAVIVLKSRLSFLTLIIILLYLFITIERRKKIKSSILFVIIFLFMFLMQDTYDLGRLGLSFQSDSKIQRFEAISFSFNNIIKNNLLFGTSQGNVYKRSFVDSYAYYNNKVTLVDPHNVYIMFLSENGFIGLLLIIIFITYNFKSRKQNKPKEYYMVIIIIIIVSFGGSQILNEISFTVISMMYLSALNYFKKENNLSRKEIVNESFIHSI